jgi:hypothetical protein
MATVDDVLDGLARVEERIAEAKVHAAAMGELIGDERRAAARKAMEQAKTAEYWLRVVQRDLAGEVA